MQGGRGRGNPFFGFGNPFGGIPSLFGGRDPFEDPFFTQPLPFGGIFSESPLMDINPPFMDMNPFGSSLNGPRASPFVNQQPPRLHETRPSFPNNSRGPIIEEINSDDEDSEKESPHQQQPYIEHPDDEFEGGQQRGTHFGNVGNDVSIMNHTRGFPQTQSFSFQSSTVTYGGSNGAYHTSSTTRRTGSDGLRFEEYKEADSVTGQAAHRLSKGIHDKGHTVTRNLKSDGRVDTMQVLHNINEDEVEVFEEAWRGKARKHLPGWSGASISNEGLGDARALPSTEGTRRGQLLGVRRKPDVTEYGQSSKFRRL